MEWDDIWKIVLGVITSLGGFSVIFIAVIKFSSDIIAKRLEEKYTLKLNKELEKYKSNLDNKIYITKTKFDAEFSIYRDLSKVFFDMVKGINILIPCGYTQVIADKEIQRKHDENNYQNANNAIVSAQDCLNSNAPFIPENIFKLYGELLNISKQQTNVFSQRWNVLYLASQEEKESLDMEDYERTDKLNKMFDELNKNIRDYLSKLDIIE